jgi:hypothetical protein
MPSKSKPKIGAEEIAERASRGEDVSSFFNWKFKVVTPIRRVNQKAPAPEPGARGDQRLTSTNPPPR